MMPVWPAGAGDGIRGEVPGSAPRLGMLGIRLTDQRRRSVMRPHPAATMRWLYAARDLAGRCSAAELTVAVLADG